MDNIIIKGLLIVIGVAAAVALGAWVIAQVPEILERVDYGGF